MVSGENAALIGQNPPGQHSFLYNLGKRILRLRWFLILGLSVFVISFEGFELLENTEAPPFSDPHVRAELFLYLLIILIVMFLTEIYVRLIKMHSQALDILRLKHVLSQDLTKTRDWDEVCQLVCQKLGELGPFDEVLLLAYQKDSATYQPASSWQAGWLQKSYLQDLIPILTQECPYQGPAHALKLKPCACSVHLSTLNIEGGYCLPVYEQGSPVARLYFHLSSGVSLSKEMSELLENIGDEIAIALTTTRLKQKYAEMKVSQATEELRRVISQDLHDTIGQNLCYMRMKLDQYSQEEIQAELDGIKPELETMRDLANDSYELVRGMLVTMSPDDSMELSDLLEYHTRLVSERTDMSIEIFHHGQPHKLDPATLHHIYFIFREALSNIERHAQAQSVIINILWGKEELQIKITDNGIGFNPDLQPERGHYGLNIMSERANNLGGRLDLLSSADKGTHLSLWLPLAA